MKKSRYAVILKINRHIRYVVEKHKIFTRTYFAVHAILKALLTQQATTGVCKYGRHTGYIASGDENYTIHAGVDPQGCVITHKSNKQIYRGIYDERSADTLDILEICKNNGLVSDGSEQRDIVATTVLKNKKIGHFSTVLEHEMIDVITKPFEWSPAMIKDATKFMIDLALKLDRLGLGLQDLHQYNIAFYKNRFTWFDFGSLVKRKTMLIPVKKLIEKTINPLWLISKGEEEKAYLFLSSAPALTPSYGHVKYADIKGYLSFGERINYQWNYSACRYYFMAGNIVQGCAKLYKLLDSITYETKANTVQSGQDEALEHIGDMSQWGKREATVYQMIQQISPKRIMLIGEDAIDCCFVLSSLVEKCMIADPDLGNIDKIYLQLKKSKNIENIVPVVFDIVSPAPAYGNDGKPVGDDGIVSQQSAKTRLKSDCVLVLSLVHHLVFGRRLNFAEIVNQLKGFTNQYAIIEFIKSDDEVISCWMNEKFEWYTIENFKRELGKAFKIVMSRQYGSETRVLLLCKKIDANAENR